MLLLLHFFSIFLLNLAFTQDLEVNNKCSYSMGKTAFICNELSDVNKNIDQFLTSNTHMLTIKNSKEVKFKSQHHNNPNYRNIITYNIVDNDNLEIEENAFNGLINLNYMRINGNYLQILKNKIFHGLTKLELLNLSQNNLTEIEVGALAGLKNLVTLTISNNNISVIRSFLFEDLENLQILLLGDNRIKTIEKNGLTGMPSVELIDLTHNQIGVLNSEEFNNNCPKLRTLYLSHNQIERIEGELKLQNLRFLEIDNNKLKIIGDNVFKNLINIKLIDLSVNSLSNITAAPFQGLSTLRHLHLRKNNIKNGEELSKSLEKEVLLIL